MKIAVTYEDGMVYGHFGHTAAFKIYEVREGKVVAAQVVETNGSGHGALAGLLAEQGVQMLICGGIGGGARFALGEAGIVICGGVSGDADEAVELFLTGGLNFDPNATCSHHHGEDHSCGSHGCGSHSCGSHGCGGH